MHGTIRHYASSELADQLAARSDEVESLMSNVPGLRSYHLIRTEDGCASVTVCDDQAGTDESTRIAGNWIRENLPNLAPTAPDISSGEVIVQAGSTVRA
ncbi:MAG: hypothetical protein QOF08_3081 [Gaiellales bacterium]|nr:hypothetical protein [Gaiellales bacterium]